MTGRTMPMDQLSKVMIWKREKRLRPTLPNQSGKDEPKRFVASTAAV